MNRIKVLFEDLTWNSEYKFLEYGKDDDELNKIAERRGIILPSPDLAIFKCRYALLNEFNKNGCKLPRIEVEKALKTLVGKLIDFNHERKRTCGYWLDDYLTDSEIISYGVFWKSAFKDEYDIIKRDMEEGKKKVSFESWGDRIYHNNDKTKYSLTNIHFAGGALLDRTVPPAFKTAEVLEFSAVMPKNKECTHCKDCHCETTEKSTSITVCQYCQYSFDYNSVVEYKMGCVKCPKCFAIIDQTGKVLKIPQIKDFSARCPSCKIEDWEILEKSNEQAKIKCNRCVKEFELEFEVSTGNRLEGLYDVVDLKTAICPQCSNPVPFGLFFSEKEKELKCKKCSLKFPYKIEYIMSKKRIKSIKEIKEKKREELEKREISSKKEDRQMPDKIKQEKKEESPVKAEEATKEVKDIDKPKLTEKKPDFSQEELNKKLEEAENQLKIVKEEFGKKLKEAEDKLKTANEEIAKIKKETEANIKKVEEAKNKELADLKKAHNEDKANAIEKAKKVTERKINLGDFAEGLSDDDLMDDTKYENAQLKLQLAIKDGKKINKGRVVKMEIGTKDKDKNKEVWEKNKRVDHLAFPKEKKE